MAALDKWLEFAEANPDETRAILDEYTEIDPAVKEAMVMPRFATEFSEDAVPAATPASPSLASSTEPVDFAELLP